MGKLLTIVVAAYNKENLIRRCLDSLIVDSGLMKRVQVIVVDDGSCDKTLSVAREYKRRFPESFVVVGKENGNYGSVMNYALPLAKGKYFRTLDADDWFDADAYRNFLVDLEQTDADMVISQRVEYLEQEDRFINLVPSFSGEVRTGEDLSIKQVNWASKTILSNINVPHITYKTSILRQSGLVWLEHVFYSDTMYDFWPLSIIRTVRFIPETLYVYVTGFDEQSMSPAQISKNYSHFIQVARAIVDEYKKVRDLSSPINVVQQKLLNQILDYTSNILVMDSTKAKLLQPLYVECMTIPELTKHFDEKTYHGIYVYKKEMKGKLPILFRVMRLLSIAKNKCWA